MHTSTIIVLTLFFLPALVAAVRKSFFYNAALVLNAGAVIGAFTTMLGNSQAFPEIWTFTIWLVALALAVTGEAKKKSLSFGTFINEGTKTGTQSDQPMKPNASTRFDPNRKSKYWEG